MKNKINLFLTMLFFSSEVWAVIIAGGNGSENTNGSGVIGWDYVGRISAANGAPSSVTYLGNSWFITAYHVKSFDNPTGVVLNATSYTINTSSWTRITNSTGSKADLVMFKVTNSISGLPSLSIANGTPAPGTALTMIGNGLNRASNLTYWSSSWVETNQTGMTYSGYKWSSGTTKRWGSNEAEVSGLVSYSWVNQGITNSCTNAAFYTDFDNVSGEAQGATYDSGGGVFIGTTNSWQLAGIMLTVGTYSGQPAGTSVFGDETYMADLATYRDQIGQTIPEPSTGILLVGVSIIFGIIKRLRYMYQ
jgi:hypothetical protein